MWACHDGQLPTCPAFYNYIFFIDIVVATNPVWNDISEEKNNITNKDKRKFSTKSILVFGHFKFKFGQNYILKPKITILVILF